MADEEVSLRDSLDAAFEKADEAAVVEKEAVDVPAKEAAEEPPADEKTDEKPAPKDEKAPEAKPRTDNKVKVAPKADTTETPTQLPKSKAPGSWKPTAREKWAGLPPEIQQEVLRRERDIATGFNEVSQVKKFREDFGSIVSQHQNIINAEGGDAMKMTRDLYTTAAALYNGSQQQKVMTVAGMIKNFNIDLRMLDSVLAGEPQQQQGQGQQGGGQDAMAIIRREIQAALQPILGKQSQELEQEVSGDVEAFANDPANEFFEDVKDTMADLLEVAAKQGRKMDLSTAYQRATLMHSEIADVIAGRTLQSKAAANSNAAAQARKRAVSIKGAPSKELASGEFRETATLGDDIRASIDALSG